MRKCQANTSRVTRLTGIPKLEDANDAGAKNSAETAEGHPAVHKKIEMDQSGRVQIFS